MESYPFKEIEPKWQHYWETHKTFAVHEDPNVPPEKRKYILDMFPYPSAAGLHVGHPEGYTATDIYCRWLRMRGYQVLHPMGFDSFGLPAENYAIQSGVHPRVSTEENIARFRKQIKALGLSYDWDREVSTHEPTYYKWTQWIFLQLYKRDLAYMAKVPVWFCPALGTVLANEEVLLTDEGPRSERGNHPVERRALRQWMLRITRYADRLLEDLDELDWPESIKTMQRNWIGKSEGATLTFEIKEHAEKLEIFTTRPDTLGGTTFMVLAPEHPLVEQITTAPNRVAVQKYVKEALNRSDLERTDLAREKSGIFCGAYAINPLNQQPIPIWIAEYVLISYGTGAIMAVPAHDTRDYEFATAHALPIVSIYANLDEQGKPHIPELPCEEGDVIINSEPFNGQHKAECIKQVIAWAEKNKLGQRSTQYRLRDWIFSRQRYWGEPIPLVHVEDGTVVPLSEDDLPLTLPEVARYQPSGNGESPLAEAQEWIHTEHPPHSGTRARRESNTMPQWAGSCWYYLRYLDPHNDQALASPEKIDYWLPVDLYVGGAEHAVLHLLYARFWHKVFYDMGLVKMPEPFQKLVNQGLILGEGGAKMSKSLGNVINPDDIIAEYGADSLRLYEMFMGPLQASKPWNTRGLVGMLRFLNRVWKLQEELELTDKDPPHQLLQLLHITIKKVSEDIENLNFNTAISQLMILINNCSSASIRYRAIWKPFVIMLSAFAPHIGEELWKRLGEQPSIARATWPAWDSKLVQQQQVTVAVQINGKLRGTLSVAAGLSQEELTAMAQEQPFYQRTVEKRSVSKVIYVPDKIINFVVGSQHS